MADKCLGCGDCTAYARRLVAIWYPETLRAPRRSREEVVLEREAKAKARAARREFFAKRRAEKEAKIKGA